MDKKHSSMDELKPLDIWRSQDLRALSREYEFYQYLDDQKRPLGGQFFAIREGQTPLPSTNGSVIYAAVIKKIDRPNPEVGEGLLNKEFIIGQKLVVSRNPAATVANAHPNLIHFLLAQPGSRTMS